MVKVKAVNHIGVRVRDRAAAERFYIGVLGLQPHPSKTNWLSSQSGEFLIHLMPATDRSLDGQDETDLARHFAFEVDDLKDCVTTLLNHGFAPFQTKLDPTQRLMLTGATDLSFGIGTVLVADPDGNIVEFVDPDRGILAEVLGSRA